MTLNPAVMGFVSGAITVGYLVAGLFFLRFWQRTRDTLFLAFAAAFALMAVNQAAPVLFGIPSESVSRVYVFRLLAFLLIIGAILAKNMARPR